MERQTRRASEAAARSSSQERAFLVGVEYHQRRVKTSKAEDEGITSSARMARDSVQAASEAAKASRQPQFTAEESLAELRELAESAGASVVGEVLQRRDKPDPATIIGKGKMEELEGAASSARADVILFDHDLSPSQQRNLENGLSARVIDRTQLILDIFARHARTREGQLQVELAQLEYMLPRLAGHGIEMSQLGGGIGTRGPGETQLETDRRKIYRRIRHIKEQIENVRRTRRQQRQRRESVPVSTVALVGYTNAGKSTLFNALTKAGVVASSRMFATLDPTIRSVTLPSRRKVLLSDTVGFIRNLPHTLVSAFRATLEEVERAALVVHVSDATSPIRTEQDAQVEKVLRELEAEKKPRLRVINKVDLLPAAEREPLRDEGNAIYVSALRGEGLKKVLERIDAMLEEDPLSEVRLRVPQADGKTLALLEAGARIYSRKYRDGMVEMEAQVSESLLRKVEKFASKPRKGTTGAQSKKLADS